MVTALPSATTSGRQRVQLSEAIMCRHSRRTFLAAGGAFLSIAAERELLARARSAAAAAEPASAAREVAPGVFFLPGDPEKTGCNRGWVVLGDYVLVVDAGFPAGAAETVAAVRATTDRPIRFAFSTHHHGDHLYGNQVLADQGAIGVAHANALRELERTETGHYGGAPGRWEEAARERPDVAASRLKPPSVTFRGELVFADRSHRVELHHFGTAHTLGDAFAWLPRERILFSGDACVNGPFNFVGDGHVGQWVGTLDAGRALDPKTVCPGHGPVAEGSLLGDQQTYFRRVVELVERRLQMPARDLRAQVEQMRTEALSDPRIARYAQASSFYDPFPDHVEKVYEELTGKKLAGRRPSRPGGAVLHARAHGAGIAGAGLPASLGTRAPWA
jgi:glyoxylase-like metal-dependent hydrolase (beta-lactamase superfamily II)